MGRLCVGDDVLKLGLQLELVGERLDMFYHPFDIGVYLQRVPQPLQTPTPDAIPQYERRRTPITHVVVDGRYTPPAFPSGSELCGVSHALRCPVRKQLMPPPLCESALRARPQSLGALRPLGPSHSQHECAIGRDRSRIRLRACRLLRSSERSRRQLRVSLPLSSRNLCATSLAASSCSRCCC